MLEFCASGNRLMTAGEDTWVVVSDTDYDEYEGEYDEDESD